MDDLKIALFPGSFDPLTLGHEDIVKRALPLFDKVIIGIGSNSDKHSLFGVEERLKMVRGVFESETKIEVAAYNGLTSAFCQKKGVTHLIRGLRNGFDFEYERTIAWVNQDLVPCLETVFFVSRPEHSAVSSSMIRDLLKYGASCQKYLSPTVIGMIEEMKKNG